ncbi:MAG TPA: hypothetical protein VM262_08240 [Acidimicrobiales bacterium]|nr:hypothetical protein [Acidimicrobiales bacterium]
MKLERFVGAAVAAGVLVVGGIAGAAVTFDPDAGSGFVGKGDVQLALGWNNKTLQDNAASVQFRFGGEEITEVSWVCTNTNNENTQERARTTTNDTQGVVASVARERNQVTGFHLTGYSGSVTSSSTTEGPALNSCPSGPWTLTSPAGDPEVIGSSGGGLEVSADGADWHELG